MSREIRPLARGPVAIVLAACVVAALAKGADTAPPVVIQLRIIEGDGAVSAVGSRATRGLAVRVTDEASKPVEGATVSFQLPGDGPSGTFPSGGKNEIVTTKSDGIATVWGMQWNKNPGAFEIRVTASKGQARAGLAVAQFLSDAVKAGGEGTFTASHASRKKWLWIGAIGAAAGAGFAFREATVKGALPAGPTTTPLQIGTPTLTIGHP